MRAGPKRVLGTGTVAAFAYAGWRAWRSRVPASPDDVSWDSAPFPFPPVPRPSVPARPSPEPE